MKKRELEARPSLSQTLDFDGDDLAANRDGYLTIRQRAVLNSERAFWHSYRLVIFVILPIAIIAAIWDGIRIHDTVASRCGIVIFELVVASILNAYAQRNWKQVNEDLLKGDVLSSYGEIVFVGYRRGRKYVISVGKVQFRISRWVYQSFEPGSEYCVYYTPFSKRLLSAEFGK